jgi:hypothetical protein
LEFGSDQLLSLTYAEPAAAALLGAEPGRASA